MFIVHPHYINSGTIAMFIIDLTYLKQKQVKTKQAMITLEGMAEHRLAMYVISNILLYYDLLSRVEASNTALT